jgi:hypothetical protein
MSNPSLKTYIVYDDSRNIEYLNLKGEVIGAEFGVSRKLKSSLVKTKKTRKLAK